LPADYDSLAAEALRYLAAQGGPEAVAAFARQRVAGLERRYASRLADAPDDLMTRADVLVEAMTEDGYAASARPVAGGPLHGVQLCQGHCPVGRVAEEFPQFCDAETEAISRLLGVHVQRLATLAGGAHVCTTFIPTAALSRPPAGSGTPEPAPALDLENPTPERASR
jgi:predicted ArsR family transcriptional regulator